MLKPLPVFYQEYSYYCFQTFKDLMCLFCALFIVAGCKGKNNILSSKTLFKNYLKNNEQVEPANFEELLFF